MAAEDTRDTLRRVDFSEAGEGVYLHLRNSGIKVLFALYGSDYFRLVELGLTLGDMGIIENVLDQSTKKDGQKIKIDIDDLDHITLEALQDKLMDAFCLSANGRLYKEQLEYLKEQARKMADEGKKAEEVPPTVPADTSETSNEDPTGQDSTQESSTT